MGDRRPRRSAPRRPLSTRALTDFGIRVAASYLNIPITWVPVVREVQAFFQGIWIAWQAVTNRAYFRDVPDVVTGTDLIPELAKLAAERGYSMYLLDKKGGLGQDTPKAVAERLRLLYPQLNIVGAETVDSGSQTVIRRIQKAHPDILLVAFGFPLQEQFIAQHIHRLGATVAIGVGGAFDYIAGFRARPPKWLRGKFEWLWRLLIPSGHSFTEYRRRASRILTAFPLFPLAVFAWKLRWGAGLHPVTALALDFGGVTNANGVESVVRHAWRMMHVRQYPALILFYFRYIQDLELGKIAEVEVWTKFMRYIGTKRDLAELRQSMIEGFVPNEPIWEIVRRVKNDQSVRLALLTNNIAEWMRIWEKEYHLSDYFDPIIASCFVKKRKPNPAIFRLLTKELGIPPGETIFVDDHRRNVLMARRLGFRAIHCSDPRAAAEDLREILPTA